MMKKSIALAIALILCLSAVLCGCTPRYDTSPDMVEGVRWITYDYSFFCSVCGYFKVVTPKISCTVSTISRVRISFHLSVEFFVFDGQFVFKILQLAVNVFPIVTVTVTVIFQCGKSCCVPLTDAVAAAVVTVKSRIKIRFFFNVCKNSASDGGVVSDFCF